MKLYKKKKIDFGFIILCPEETKRLLKSTTNLIKSRFPDSSFVCIVDSTTKDQELKEMNEFCPTYCGKNSFTSFFNTGMKHTLKDWNIFIICGTTVNSKLDEKISMFIENSLDVLYPIIDKQNNFIDATINGLTINKKAWNLVGNMADVGDLELIKTLWAIKAIEKGIKFKGVVGIRLC